jgi:hypothetical protein
MERSCSQDSKPKFSSKANVILIFLINNFYKGIP